MIGELLSVVHHILKFMEKIHEGIYSRVITDNGRRRYRRHMRTRLKRYDHRQLNSATVGDIWKQEPGPRMSPTSATTFVGDYS